MADRIIVRDTCRSCGKGGLKDILSLGEQYVSDFTDGDAAHPKIPLDLILCDAADGGCGLLQLRHSTPPAWMYNQYWYKSGLNASMRVALKDITTCAQKFVKLGAGDVVVDIGANDGTLLRSYERTDIKRVGFEPAKNLVPETKVGTDLVINDFFNFAAFEKAMPGAKAKILTSIAMFYDLEDPNSFVGDAAKLLHRDGVWIIQMSYLLSMLKTNAFDNICHEHLEYYSMFALRKLLERHGLEPCDVELNDVNGGSFRIYIRHQGGGAAAPAGAADRLAAMDAEEREFGLHERKAYDDFKLRIEERKKQLVGFVAKANEEGKKVWVYGASTKGNVLLQYYGLDHRHIAGAAEVNADKFGKKTVGTSIPIVSEADAKAANPDYFLILPWHFLDGFLKREKDYLSSGGKFLVPLPDFKVLGG